MYVYVTFSNTFYISTFLAISSEMDYEYLSDEKKHEIDSLRSIALLRCMSHFSMVSYLKTYYFMLSIAMFLNYLLSFIIS